MGAKAVWLAGGSLVLALAVAGFGGWAIHDLRQERDSLARDLSLVNSEVDQLVADAEAARLTQAEIDAFVAQLAAGQEALDEVQRVAAATFDLGSPPVGAGPSLESRINVLDSDVNSLASRMSLLESDVNSICQALIFNTDLFVTC